MARLETIFTLRDKMSAGLQRIDANLRAMTNGLNAADTGIGQMAQQQAMAAKEAQVLSTELKGMVAAVAGLHVAIAGVQKFVQMGDVLASNKARLAMIVDETSTVAELNEKVFQSAQRARGEYASMAQFISRIGSMAGDVFANNDELIKFSETIQKQMAIAGTSTAEASGSMLQLSQALASGVLRGEELNSVFENAPQIIRSIADYLDVDIGKIREMASEGLITADIVKNAVLESAAEVDAAFESMPMTWSQMWQTFVNNTMWAMRPLADLWSQTLNSEALQYTLSLVTTLMASAVERLVSFIQWAGQIPIVRAYFEGLAIIVGIVLVNAFALLGAKAISVFVAMIGKAITFAITMGMAHPVLTALISIFALVAIACAQMANSAREDFINIVGAVSGALNVIKSGFTNLYTFGKNIFHNLAEFMKASLANALNWITTKINASFPAKMLKKIGIKVDTVGKYSPNYVGLTQGIQSASEAFEVGRANGVYYANKAANWIQGKGEAIKALANQANNLSGFDASAIPTAEELLGLGGAGNSGGGGGTGSTNDASNVVDSLDDLADFSLKTEKNTKDTAKNTKDIADSTQAAVKQIAAALALSTSKHMKNIEQNIKLNINAPISGTAQQDVDGFLDTVVGALRTELANTKRSLSL